MGMIQEVRVHNYPYNIVKYSLMVHKSDMILYHSVVCMWNFSKINFCHMYILQQEDYSYQHVHTHTRQYPGKGGGVHSVNKNLISVRLFGHTHSGVAVTQADWLIGCS